jgi:hypothetical protein
MKPIIEPILDEYEQEIEDNLEKYGYHQVENMEELKAKMMLAVKAHNAKKAVNFKARSGLIEIFKQKSETQNWSPIPKLLEYDDS